MKRWDLTSGAAKLGAAFDSLKLADAEATNYWDDQNHRDFQETYLTPLAPRMKRAVEAVHRLAEVLSRAERECEETGDWQ